MILSIEKWSCERSLEKLITIPEAVRNLCPARLVSVKFSLILLVCTVSFIPKDKLDSPTKGYDRGERERERKKERTPSNLQCTGAAMLALPSSTRITYSFVLDNNFVSLVHFLFFPRR